MVSRGMCGLPLQQFLYFPINHTFNLCTPPNMEIVIFIAAAAAFVVFKSREQQRRIALLGSYLGRFEVEKLMATLMDGYMRALGEDNPERREQVWSYLNAYEERLRDQLGQLAEAFSQVWVDHARVSTLPIALPWADKLFPKAAFDLRDALHIHAQGVDALVRNSEGCNPKGKAFTLTAELMLLQHTCHWFCRSRAVAHARLVASHQTSYAQVLDAVSPSTRARYTALIRT